MRESHACVLKKCSKVVGTSSVIFGNSRKSPEIIGKLWNLAHLTKKKLEVCDMVACENSRPSSLSARVAFRETPLGPRAKKDGCFRRLVIWLLWALASCQSIYPKKK